MPETNLGSRIIFGPMNKKEASATYDYLSVCTGSFHISANGTSSAMLLPRSAKLLVEVKKKKTYMILYNVPLDKLETLTEWMTRTGFDWAKFQLVV